MKDEEKLSKELKEILANITPREAKVLRERFGIELKNDLSLEEMQKLFEVTKQRIQDIEEKALNKLREKNNPGNDDDPDDAA